MSQRALQSGVNGIPSPLVTSSYSIPIICLLIVTFTVCVVHGTSFAQHLLADFIERPSFCPQNCTCDVSSKLFDENWLKIDCENRRFIDVVDNNDDIIMMTLAMKPYDARIVNDNLPLLVQINHILMNQNYTTFVTSLSITRSVELTEVPWALCNFLRLQSVELNHNKIKKLPNDCFVRLRTLETLSLINNSLTELQDGLFDGLKYLRLLTFNFNKIHTIGLNLFSNSSDLLSLSEISFNDNELTSLETWPYIRAVVVDRAHISFERNHIRKFTNNANWKFNCTGVGKRDKSTISIMDNEFDHFTTLMEDLNFTTVVQFICFFEQVEWRLSSSAFVCDCLDYHFFSMAQFAPHASRFSEIYCHNFYPFQDTPAVSVKLDSVVCDVQEASGCPVGCRCVNQPSNMTFHVLCSNQGFTDLPDSVPPTNIPSSIFLAVHSECYKLDFSGNNISILETRSYFNNTTFIDLSNSNLKNITEDALIRLGQAKYMYLHNNMLKTLPPAIVNMSLSFKTLSLYNNPLSCTCDKLWLKSWLESIYNRLENPTAIQCGFPERLRGKILFTVNDTDFCYEPSSITLHEFDIKLLFAAILTPIAVCFLLFAVFLRCRVKAFSAWHWHPFDRDECEGEHMIYDVFLTFADEDKSQALDILDFLEKGNSLKVCFHERDFIAGNTIIENIDLAIKKSKRVLCLVSDSFIASQYGMEEFDRALHHTISLKRRRLIVLIAKGFKVAKLTCGIDEDDATFSIATPLIGRSNSTTSSSSPVAITDSRIPMLKKFLDRNTYIDLGTNVWKENLLYSMPLKRLGQTVNT